MHTNNVCAFQDGRGESCEAAVKPLVNRSGVAVRVGKNAADEGFARGADQKRGVGEGGD